MAITYHLPIRGYHKYENKQGAHVVHFECLKDDHTETYPNTDADGYSLDIGSTLWEKDTNTMFDWIGYWHERGSQPGPGPEPTKIKVNLMAVHGTLNGAEASTIEIPVSEEVQIPYDIDDHKYAYLPTQDTKDTQFLMYAKKGEFKYDIDPEKKVLKFAVSEDAAEVSILFFGVDMCALEHEGFDHVPCEYELENVELYLNEDNLSYFILNHDEKAQKKIVISKHETYLPESIVWPACFKDVSYYGGQILFYCGQNAINYSFVAHYGEPPVPPKEKEFKAVLDKYGTLTFYYDDVDHEGTTYTQSEMPTNPKQGSDWPWYKQNILAVRTDETAYQFDKFTSLRSVFEYCTATSYDLQNLNAANVTNLHSAFKYSSATEIKWPKTFGTVSSIHTMFYHCKALDAIQLPKMDSTKLLDTCSLFEGCDKLTKIDWNGLNTSQVNDMGSMFLQCSALTQLDLSSFNTTNVLDMRFMFSECRRLTSLDLRNFNTKNCSNFAWMFNECSNLKTILATENFVVAESLVGSLMFISCSSLVGGNGTRWNSSHTNAEYARIDTAEHPGYFTGPSLTTINYRSFQGEINGDFAPFWQSYKVDRGTVEKFELRPYDNTYRFDERYLWWPRTEEMAYKKVLVYADGRKLSPEEIKWTLIPSAYMPFTMEIDTTDIEELTVVFFGADIVKFAEETEEGSSWLSTYLHGNKSEAYWLDYADTLEVIEGKDVPVWFFATKQNDAFPEPDIENPIIKGVLCVREPYTTLPDRVEFPSWMDPKYCSYEKVSDEEANITFEGYTSRTFEDPIKLIWESTNKKNNE